MDFKNTKVFNFDGAIRGMRNPLESWDKSDSYSYFFDFVNGGKEKFVLGNADLKLMQNLLAASIKEGNSHSKFLRQIMVCVDITAPLYWWTEFDTYKVGTVANSTSKMHKLASTPITLSCFEIDDVDDVAYIEDTIKICEELRIKYLTSKNKKYWKALIQLLPESWLQTRTITLNYQVLRQMYFDRVKKPHKLTEWSVCFGKWIETLPYAAELIMYK